MVLSVFAWRSNIYNRGKAWRQVVCRVFDRWRHLFAPQLTNDMLVSDYRLSLDVVVDSYIEMLSGVAQPNASACFHL